jgi:putative ABC transport system ATP-binding protein
VALIELRGVGRDYQTAAGRVSALRDITLSVDVGDLVVVLGPSGSGKTTLLNVIGALDRPTAGEVVVDGRRFADASRGELFAYRRATVSFIFQTFNLFPALTAFENVRFGADVARRPRAAEVARDVLAHVGLADRMHHFPQMLSGGEQQRVAIARALATGNPILLADEPTGELDFETGVQILGLLRDEAEEGKTVVIVTHNREIARMADRVVEMSSGRVVSDSGRVEAPVPVAALRW